MNLKNGDDALSPPPMISETPRPVILSHWKVTLSRRQVSGVLSRGIYDPPAATKFYPLTGLVA